MFKTVLTSYINPEHELCNLARKIDWAYLESEFAPLFRTVGRPLICHVKRVYGWVLEIILRSDNQGFYCFAETVGG